MPGLHQMPGRCQKPATGTITTAYVKLNSIPKQQLDRFLRLFTPRPALSHPTIGNGMIIAGPAEAGI